MPSTTTTTMLWDSKSSGNNEKNQDTGEPKKKRRVKRKSNNNNNNNKNNRNNNNKNNKNTKEQEQKRKKEKIKAALKEGTFKGGILRSTNTGGNNKQQQQQQSKKNNDNNVNDSNNNKNKNKNKNKSKKLLDAINPFKAGNKLRQTLDNSAALLRPGSVGGVGIVGGGSVVSSPERRSIYYLDDRLEDQVRGGGSSTSSSSSSPAAALFSERNPLFETMFNYDSVPEVLVVGATGRVGRLVVRRLLLDGRFRVRVLVRDLYSKTLNMLGTEVTYCQGDLTNVESLEYALTDVDKIVFCASPPGVDDPIFEEELKKIHQNQKQQEDEKEARVQKTEKDWQKMESVLELRAQLAEQIDMVGMRNIIKAFQDVRFVDYGTSQAAKRTLFKFSKRRPQDFDVFSILDDDDEEQDYDYDYDDDGEEINESKYSNKGQGSSKDKKYNYETTYSQYGNNGYGEDDEYDYNDEYDYEDYEDEYGDNQYNRVETVSRAVTTMKTQSSWMVNKFGRGVFKGQVPSTAAVPGGGEATIISSRLRSKDDNPDDANDEGGDSSGIDLQSTGFAGFIIRLCSAGGAYEMFVRTSDYDRFGVEYVCEFNTRAKQPSPNTTNKSFDKFMTVRLAFSNFRPVQRRQRRRPQKLSSAITGGYDEEQEDDDDDGDLVEEFPPFEGEDVRRIGFRFRSARNEEMQTTPSFLWESKKGDAKRWKKFYLALHYIKVYRSQPEPEFVYVSDARIPPVVHSDMIRHEERLLVSNGATAGAGSRGGVISGGSSSSSPDYRLLLDEIEVKKAALDAKDRIGAETYYKYRGEEILKRSGLSYTIVRVGGYNELATGEASTLDFLESNEDVVPVSRAEVAQICTNALRDPNALDKTFYVSKNNLKQASSTSIIDDDMSEKFARVRKDGTL